MTATASMPSAGLDTPETYLGTERAQGFAQAPQPGTHSYPGASSPELNQFALRGTWTVTSQAATPAAPGGSIQARFKAARVYLVLTSAGGVPRRGRVLLDGRPISPGDAGPDVRGAMLTVTGQRLYTLVSLPSAQQHALTVELPPGVTAYDFTFG
jgi:hypothetical protein